MDVSLRGGRGEEEELVGVGGLAMVLLIVALMFKLTTYNGTSRGNDGIARARTRSTRSAKTNGTRLGGLCRGRGTVVTGRRRL